VAAKSPRPPGRKVNIAFSAEPALEAALEKFVAAVNKDYKMPYKPQGIYSLMMEELFLDQQRGVMLAENFDVWVRWARERLLMRPDIRYEKAQICEPELEAFIRKYANDPAWGLSPEAQKRLDAWEALAPYEQSARRLASGNGDRRDREAVKAAIAQGLLPESALARKKVGRPRRDAPARDE